MLHELFTTDACYKAERKSRHLYDLERMMDKSFVIGAIKDDDLWSTIHHHRDVFTHIHDVDYTPDIRDRIKLTPPAEHYQTWLNDYIRSDKIAEEAIPIPISIHSHPASIASRACEYPFSCR